MAVSVTGGVTHGLSIVGDLFVDAGDTVLLPDKLWGNYNLTYGVRRKAGISKYTFFNDRGGFDVAGFRRTLLANTGAGKLVVFTSDEVVASTTIDGLVEGRMASEDLTCRGPGDGTARPGELVAEVVAQSQLTFGELDDGERRPLWPEAAMAWSK